MSVENCLKIELNTGVMCDIPFFPIFPICFQCGTDQNPCHCKVVGPTLGKSWSTPDRIRTAQRRRLVDIHSLGFCCTIVAAVRNYDPMDYSKSCKGSLIVHRKTDSPSYRLSVGPLQSFVDVVSHRLGKSMILHSLHRHRIICKVTSLT